jgi:hypothetical protein
MKFNRLLFLGVTLAGLLVYISCRKVDRQPDKPINTSVESKFFNSHRSSDPLETSLVGFLKRENDKKHFVEPTIKQIGFPYWDKGIKVAAKSRRHGRGASDSAFVVYVPFVRDSQNYVNASLAIHIEPGDTTFSYLCDWQYSGLYNTATSVSDTAEQFAIFLMALDKSVFGHNKFSIVDSNLFRNGSNRTYYITLSDSASANNSGRNNILTPIEVCQVGTMYWFEECPYPYSDECINGCDHCILCLTPHEYTFCWDEYVDDGSGGGGGGNPPSGGGGGGTGGGSTPPPCPGGTARGATYYECQPGWNPDPTPPPNCDPFITTLQNDATFSNNFKSLNNTATTNLNYEKGFIVDNRAANNYIAVQGDNWTPEINIPIAPLKDGVLHSHYHGKNSIFSPQDVVFMAQIFLTGNARDSNNLFFGMTGHNNLYPYLIKVTNTARFRTFAKKIAGDNGNDKTKMDKFIADYERRLISPVEENNTKEFLKMMQEMGVGAGMTLYRGNDDCNQWTKINLDAFNDIIPTNCF